MRIPNLLRKKIKKLSGKKTAGTDTMDSYRIKLALPLICEAMCHVIHLLFSQKRFPEIWKPLLIFPTYKKGKKTDKKTRKKRKGRKKKKTRKRGLISRILL